MPMLTVRSPLCPNLMFFFETNPLCLPDPHYAPHALRPSRRHHRHRQTDRRLAIYARSGYGDGLLLQEDKVMPLNPLHETRMQTVARRGAGHNFRKTPRVLRITLAYTRSLRM